MSDLLASKGLGYAQAAELNHYPGPAHVLRFTVPLDLTPDQERALDSLFAAGRITPEMLARLTGAIALTEGQLRAVHLAAHLQMKAILTPEQIARGDQLRGYTAADGIPIGVNAPAPGDHRP